MRRFIILMLALIAAVSVTACSNKESGQSQKEPVAETDAEVQSAEQETRTEQTDSIETKQEDNSFMKMNIQIGDNKLTAVLVQNSSTEALVEMLSEGPVTIDMNDYAGMEKVGMLPKSLPRNDEQISTGAGDLILYQGNSFVIYYDTNSWNLTRLGEIEHLSQQELVDVLGSGSVTAVLSLPEE